MSFNPYNESQNQDKKILVCHLKQDFFDFDEATKLSNWLNEQLCPDYYDKVLCLNGIERIDII